MAQKTTKKGKESEAYEKASFVGFHNVTITDKHKEQINKGYDPTKDSTSYIDELHKYGYKVAVGYDYERLCAIVSVIGSIKGCANAGYTVSFLHSDTKKAIFIAFWYVALLNQYNQWPVKEGREHLDNW